VYLDHHGRALQGSPVFLKGGGGGGGETPTNPLGSCPVDPVPYHTSDHRLYVHVCISERKLPIQVPDSEGNCFAKNLSEAARHRLLHDQLKGRAISLQIRDKNGYEKRLL
jgi:hypothetical protein